ncbi:hypothetical protein MIND_01036500 [Mycena indigotica]|uniref:Uncharacterized protein n=1 Tax=Mycena indigotica TaxID=2126181 RepID=A0A8H6W0K9_9AGAR|nr:uncharacterized protein MIND_01036500 [Mycena indigotica]KAF7294984.1 hypothetical protein MIND_01036500 [Mycena indigotica]
MASEEDQQPQAHVDERREEQPVPQESNEEETDALAEASEERAPETVKSPILPEIPLSNDLELDLDSILSPSNPPPTTDKVQKRASSVLKLTQENEKLKAELKAMTDRLEAAERRRLALARKEQHIMEPPSS